MIYLYKIKLDIKEDAWNWFVGCNRTNYRSDWTQRAPKDVLEKIHGKTKEEAYSFLMPFLKQKYVDEKVQIEEYKKYLTMEYDKKFQKGCETIVELLGKPLYRNDFEVFLTTFPRGPYNKDGGSLWQPVGWLDPIRGFLHELLHFQFIHYWLVDGSQVSKLTENQFDWIKESLTVIIDEDFFPLIERADNGYEVHKEYRLKLHEFWKKNKDFDKLVEFGLKILPEYCLV